MGKWTLGHHDEVLQSKMKNLVIGAVQRIKLEAGEPPISYETFVEGLDEGDSFTATLVEVLVKEMADRRTRTSQLDRRLISERTAKSLRMQAAPLHVYSSRRHNNRNRSGYTVADLVAEITDEEDEPTDTRDSQHVDTLWDGEGARLNTELYEAYVPTSYAAPSFAPSPQLLDRLRHSETTGDSDVGEPIVLPVSPRSVSPPLRSLSHRSGSRSHGTGIGASLSRSDSTRRPARSRTVDFNEFTARRRSSIRQTSQEQTQVRAEPEESTDGTWRFRLTRGGSLRDGQPPLASPSSAHTPAVVPAHLLLRGEIPRTLDTSEGHSDSNADLPSAASSSSSGPSSSQTWYALTTGQSTAVDDTNTLTTRRSSISDINEARRQVIAPRLRRGGIRPPETLLSRYASPAAFEAMPPSPPPPDLHPPPADSILNVLRHSRPEMSDTSREMLASFLGRREQPDGGSTSQLPTPRSVTPVLDPAEAHENPW
ncbi:uncharacterized protein C8Q71DRAFT_772024 [Rhodofomes roseus]|uniref:Uncharacterized protein n=1 Tax=Rhodofomes roseus TaxID=34475 RepID=A0ABQ8K8M3_9APHY|nr:uncharacterized protein C8Q71DRAFT_772024 [Rhodofomes roseus]KAH9833671.1 hypothetical protein C8Q71DRAFT_772024 [Rhodofomes roseus]